MATRDNGLVAARYVELTQLDPRVADAMLAVLRSAGIAAYAEPSHGYHGPNIETVLPNRPLDQLWVDGTYEQRARDLVRAQLIPEPAPEKAEPRPDDEEAAWARIVALFDDVATEPVPRWPASEDVTEAAGNDPAADAVRSPERPAWRLEPAEPDDEAADFFDDEEHFVPPPPPPLPKPQLATKRAITAIVVGIALIFAPKIWPSEVPEAATFFGVVGVLGGLVALVMGMREGRSGTGPDDGAVV